MADPALTPAPALVARFRSDLEALTGELPSPERRLGIAVSGGGDSVALLLLAAAAYPGAIAAATVDHGLRPEAAAEAAGVGAICARIQVPHSVLEVPATWSFEGNLQARARLARYALLDRWARTPDARWVVPRVAVAHQRDDVAESFIMRAARGSGVGGLAAMARARPVTSSSPTILVRPLLDWSRQELAGIVHATGIEPAHDPSNGDPRFDRSRARAALEAVPDCRSDRLARAASNLRDAEDALEWMVLRDLKTRFRMDENEDLWLDVTDLPFELRRRFVRRAIEEIRQENGMFDRWRDSRLEGLVRSLDDGGRGTMARVLATATTSGWYFTLAPPRRTS